MSEGIRQTLIATAERWVRMYGIPLPVDMVARMIEVGLDPKTIEARLLGKRPAAIHNEE